MTTGQTTYTEQIRRLAEPLLEAEGMELVLVECLKMRHRWLVRLYIDQEEGVTVGDCAAVSAQLGDILDVHDIPAGPYTLEVSSPGLDRPLVRDKDFLQYRGSMVRVTLKEKREGIRNFVGVLTDYREDAGRMVLVVSAAGQTHVIPRENVAKANLEYEF
jgi:ribosome maturation factor RimP